MKTELPYIVEKRRVTVGPLASKKENGRNGAFLLGRQKDRLVVVCSDSGGWDHVSVSRNDRCPTWREMCWVKSLFFDEDETVVQFHPKASDYVNIHPNCLHMWRKHDVEYALPPKIFV